MIDPKEKAVEASKEAGRDGRSGQPRPSITIEPENIAVKTGVNAGGDGGSGGTGGGSGGGDGG